MHSFDITMKNLSKMEGHADLDVKVRDGKAEDVRFKITDSQRFYEQAVRNQSVSAAPQLMARICGTCSNAHLICSIEAIEKALGIVPSEQALMMKKLTMYGLMIRDHALHLYFFSLPDLIGKDSILDFDEKNEKEHKLLHDAFDVKRAGNLLSTLVAGKAVHAPFPTIGGFLKTPDKTAVKNTIEELRRVRPSVIDLVDIFHRWHERFDRDTDHVALVTKDFSFLEGEIRSSNNLCVKEKDYMDHLVNIVIPYSQSRSFEFEGEDYLVGAISRVNLNKSALHKETKKSAAKYLKAFPSNNVFHNNLAQAIEILHSIDHSIEILESSDFVKEELQKAPSNKGTGVGVIEAPRGTLYNKFVIANNKIKNATVVVPTSQNQINIENDIAKLVEDRIKDMRREEIEYEIEKLIRAYDPCMSCATHFLRVRWL